jgi:hypothetical protein
MAKSVPPQNLVSVNCTYGGYLKYTESLEECMLVRNGIMYCRRSTIHSIAGRLSFS